MGNSVYRQELAPDEMERVITMVSAVRKTDQHFTAQKPAVDTAAFERDLTELSRRHGIGIAGSATLFVMEPDDYDRTYSSDAQSRLQFI
jgi:hypothetical protein